MLQTVLDSRQTFDQSSYSCRAPKTAIVCVRIYIIMRHCIAHLEFPMKLFSPLTALMALTAAALMACGGGDKSDSPPTSTTVEIQTYITDALDTEYSKVWVAIRKITLVDSTGVESTLVDISRNPRVINLSALSRVGHFLAKARIKPGLYKEIRVTLANRVKLVSLDGTVTKTVKFSATGSEYLWTAKDVTVDATASGPVVVDFNLARFTFDPTTNLVTPTIELPKPADAFRNFNYTVASANGVVQSVDLVRRTITIDDPLLGAGFVLTLDTDPVVLSSVTGALLTPANIRPGDAIMVDGVLNRGAAITDPVSLSAAKIQTGPVQTPAPVSVVAMPAQVIGQVVSVNAAAQTVTVTDRVLGSVVITTSNNPGIVNVSGTPITLTSIVPGSTIQVGGTLIRADNGTATLNATRIAQVPTPAAATAPVLNVPTIVTCIVQSVDPVDNTVTVYTPTVGEAIVTTTTSPRIVDTTGSVITLEALKPGSTVQVSGSFVPGIVLDSSGVPVPTVAATTIAQVVDRVGTVPVVSPVPVTVTGVIVNVDSFAGTVTLHDKVEGDVVVTIDQGAVFSSDGRPLVAGDIKVGSTLQVTGTMSPGTSAKDMQASLVVQLPDTGPLPSATGVVVRVDGFNVTVDVLDSNFLPSGHLIVVDTSAAVYAHGVANDIVEGSTIAFTSAEIQRVNETTGAVIEITKATTEASMEATEAITNATIDATTAITQATIDLAKATIIDVKGAQSAADRLLNPLGHSVNIQGNVTLVERNWRGQRKSTFWLFSGHIAGSNWAMPGSYRVDASGAQYLSGGYHCVNPGAFVQAAGMLSGGKLNATQMGILGCL